MMDHEKAMNQINPNDQIKPIDEYVGEFDPNVVKAFELLAKERPESLEELYVEVRPLDENRTESARVINL